MNRYCCLHELTWWGQLARYGHVHDSARIRSVPLRPASGNGKLAAVSHVGSLHAFQGWLSLLEFLTVTATIQQPIRVERR